MSDRPTLPAFCPACMKAVQKCACAIKPVGSISRRPLLDVTWVDATEALMLPVGTQIYTADALNAAREQGRQEMRAEVDRLRNALKLIAAQDQGCGGRVTEAEAWRSARTIALDALKEKCDGV